MMGYPGSLVFEDDYRLSFGLELKIVNPISTVTSFGGLIDTIIDEYCSVERVAHTLDKWKRYNYLMCLICH